MDRQELIRNMREEISVPKDAGEYEKDLKEILERIPAGWGKWISCDKGWYKLLAETNDLLKYMCPNYEVHQVKEKFGELRYYFSMPKMQDDDEFDKETFEKIYKIMRAIAARAEDKSTHICESCGEFGQIRDSNHWLKTLCYYCAKEQDYPVEDWEEARYSSKSSNDN